MNFLTLCKRVNNLVGFQGVVTSVDVTGYQAVLVQSVKDAWEDIQRFRSDWDFMRGTKVVNIGSTSSYYTLQDLWATETPDLDIWKYILYDTKRLTEFTYDAFQLLDFSEWSGHEPLYYAIDPASKGLHISPVDAVYQLDIYYIRSIQVLSESTEVPYLPERFHMAIVYGAVMKLSTFIGNPTLYDMYSLKYAEAMGQLMREENPPKFVRKRPVA